MDERYLADTHVLIWTLNDDARLSEAHRAILASGQAVHFSAASVWEIVIKQSIGKLSVPDRVVVHLLYAGFLPLGISPSHAEYVSTLPFHHRDPFDRLLIAQAKLEGLSILTVDRKFSDYDVQTL